VRFALDEDQIALEQTLRKFLETEQPLTAVRKAMEQGYHTDTWQRMVAEIGVSAVGLPESVGGTGDSLLDQVVIATELGRALDPGPFLPSIAIVARVLHEAGPGWVTDAWLPTLLEGERTAALAAWEEGSGPLPAWGATTAVQAGGDWQISGAKRFVLHGAAVDDLLVLAGTGAGPSLFRVARTAQGVTTTSLDVLDATRPLADVILREAPAELVGELGSAIAPLAVAWRRLRVLVAAEQLGSADRILELTTDYAKTRSQFGRPIGSFQAIKHLLADAMLEIEAAKTAVMYAGWAFDHDQSDLDLISELCLAVAGDAFLGISKAAIQAHGAIGFTWEHDAHLFLKRATAMRQLFGTPDEHRDAIAAAIFDCGLVSQDLCHRATPDATGGLGSYDTPSRLVTGSVSSDR
jgi:alkylation response protein AidB-like acyl-CoA dehydrogenase